VVVPHRTVDTGTDDQVFPSAGADAVDDLAGEADAVLGTAAPPIGSVVEVGGQEVLP
jgi:hypothetical protein